jgi:pilus assembly protein Flp/PilA
MKTKLFTRLLKDESGQDLIDYALIAALLALGSIAVMGPLANDIAGDFNNVGNSI